MNRRAALTGLLGLVAVAAACSRAERCRACGMKLDRSSRFAAYLVDDAGRELAFDTPKCALGAARSLGGQVKEARFRAYYSQALRPAGELRFVAGSDILGPMGSDLIPVEAARAAGFAKEHGGAAPKSMDELMKEGLP